MVLLLQQYCKICDFPIYEGEEKKLKMLSLKMYPESKT